LDDFNFLYLNSKLISVVTIDKQESRSY